MANYLRKEHKIFLEKFFEEYNRSYAKIYYILRSHESKIIGYLIQEEFKEHASFRELYTFEIKLVNEYKFNLNKLKKFIKKLGYRLNNTKSSTFYMLLDNTLIFHSESKEELGSILVILDNLDTIIEQKSATPFIHHGSE